MEILNLSKKKFRYFSIPHYHLCSQSLNSLSKSLCSVSSTSKTLVSPKHTLNQVISLNRFRKNVAFDSQYLQFNKYDRYKSSLVNIGWFKCCSHYWFRCFSLSSSSVSQFGKLGNDGLRPDATSKQVLEIIDLIKSDENDLETKLNALNLRLSAASVNQIFWVLNSEKVSAFRFFYWIKKSNPDFSCHSDIFSLVFDNCGRLDDFEPIFFPLNDFGPHDVCLNQKAFGFLGDMISSKALNEKSVCKVIEVLNRIGGSCCASGIHALIEMFCILGSIEMAKYVIQKTEMFSCYNILIRQKCKRRDFEGAKEMLLEMSNLGCNPNSQTYNYMLSCLCKNGRFSDACKLFQIMIESCLPDAITFEVLIYYLCRCGNFDFALKLLGRMALMGIEPRLTTHAAFIKGYFRSQRYEEAYQYAVGYSDKYKKSSNKIYSLLARLHDRKGNPVIAQKVLSKMIRRGLKPNFAVYKRVMKHLQKSGRDDLAKNLEISFARFTSTSSTDAKKSSS